MPESNLLAYLAIQCRVDYISDLSLTLRCKTVIEHIREDSFTLSEWNDTIHYLCKNKDLTFDSKKLAKEYLLHMNNK